MLWGKFHVNNALRGCGERRINRGFWQACHLKGVALWRKGDSVNVTAESVTGEMERARE
jgi:hypothetical protein